MLSLTRVSLARGKRLLARDLDLQLDRPGLNVLHGASGCGKSSLLRLLKGLLAPAAGERHLASGMREADIGLLRFNIRDALPGMPDVPLPGPANA